MGATDELGCERKHLGARSELHATVWLLDRGYEVFRNVSQHGGIDLIAAKEGVFLLLDVKTASQFRVDGTANQGVRLTPEQIARGVKVLYVRPDGQCFLDDDPRARPEQRKCDYCGDSYAPIDARQKFCSVAHRNRFYLESGRYPKKRATQ